MTGDVSSGGAGTSDDLASSGSRRGTENGPSVWLVRPCLLAVESAVGSMIDHQRDVPEAEVSQTAPGDNSTSHAKVSETLGWCSLT